MYKRETGGDLKVNILEVKYKDKLKFPGWRGWVQNRNLQWGAYRYFLGLQNVRIELQKRKEKKRKLNKILTILYKFDCLLYVVV